VDRVKVKKSESEVNKDDCKAEKIEDVTFDGANNLIVLDETRETTEVKQETSTGDREEQLSEDEVKRRLFLPHSLCSRQQRLTLGYVIRVTS